MTPMPTSTSTRMLPLPKRILAVFLAFVLAIGFLPAAPAKAYAADTIAASAGSKTVTRTVEFYYDDESTPFDSVKEQFTFTWGKGTNLTQFTHTFPTRLAAEYWSEYPEDTWTFEPETVPEKTVNAATGEDFKQKVIVKVAAPTSSQKGTTIVKFVNKDTKEEITSLTVSDVVAGTPFTQPFSSGPYANKNLVQAVDDVIGQLSATYELADPADNPITESGRYQAGNQTYTVKLTLKDTSHIDTSVVVRFVDQYDNDIALDGYLAQINSGNNPSLNGRQFTEIRYNNNQTLPQMVQSKREALEGLGYTFISSNFPEDGKFGPTAQEFTVRMHKPSIEDGTITPPADVYYNGSSQKPEPTVVVNGKTLVKGTDYIAIYPGETWTLGSSDVSQEGDTVNAGVKQVRIIGWGDYAGYETTTSYQILPLAIVASISQTDFTYNGNIQRPTITVVDANGDTVPSSAYTITWKNASSREQGSYSVEVAATPDGNYEGSARFVYNINAAPTPDPISIGTSNKSISVEGPAATTYNGSKQNPGSIVVKDGSKVLKEGTDYAITWNNTAFTNAGSYTATITGKGAYKDKRTVTYTINKARIASVELSANAVQEGATKPTYVVKDANGRTLKENIDYTVAWSPALNMNKAGTYTITATPKGNNFTTDTAKAQLNVSAKPLDEIGSPSVTVDIADVTYNATSQKVKPTVKSGSTTLKEGTDYTLSYSSDTTNAGTVTVTIVGKGNFTGSRTVSYKILPAEITSVTAPDQVYDGKKKEPTPTVKAGNLTVPTSGYTATYTNNTNAGTATVKVTGKGNFTGTASGTFNISKVSLITTVAVNFVDDKDNPITSVSPNPYTWEGLSDNEINPTAQAEVNKTITFLENFYMVDQTEWTSFQNGLHPKVDTTLTIKCTPRTTYDVYIKFYTGNKNNLRYTIGPITGTTKTTFGSFTMKSNDKKLPAYVDELIAKYQAEGYTQVNDNGWDQDKNGTIKEDKLLYEIVLTRPNSNVNSFNVSVSPSSTTYNGTRQVPTITVERGSETLVQGQDYTVSWAPNSNLVNAGEYTATIQGVASRGYEGSQDATYTIKKVGLASVELSTNSATKGAAQPTYVVKDKNGNVVPASNYDAKWTPSLDMDRPRSYTLTVTAKDTSVNYTGTATTTFEVSEDQKTRIEDCIISGINDVLYNATSQKVEPTVTNGSATLKKGTDYTLSYSSDTTNAGTVTVTIVGKGNFTGSRTVTYKILPAEITSVTAPDQVYDGKKKEPTPTVKAGNLTVPASGYTATYTNNTNAGKATVKVTGKGNFTGTAEDTFEIKPASLWTMDSIADVDYTGKAITPTVVVKNSAGTTLKEGTDYMLSYKDASGSTVSSPTSVGTYVVTATGKGNYTGTVQRTFRIVNPATGSTIVRTTVHFKNKDGSDFAYITPNPLTVSGIAGNKPNKETVSKLNDILDGFADSYTIERKDWDTFSKNAIGNTDGDITITFTKQDSGSSGGGTTTPTARSSVKVAIKAVDDNGSTTTTYTLLGEVGTAFSSANQYQNVEGKIAELKKAGYTAESNDTWTKNKNGKFPSTNNDTPYTITLTKPGTNTGSGSGGSTTPAKDSYVRVVVVDEDSTQLGGTNIWHGNTNMKITTSSTSGSSLKTQADAAIKEWTDKGYTYQAASNKEWESIKKTATYPAGGTSWDAYKTVTVKLDSGRVSLSKATVTFSPASYTYDGTDKKPKVVVKVNNKEVPASEYTITWPSDVKNAGSKSVTVTAKSTSKTYKDSAKASYTIAKAKVTPPSASDKTFNGQAQRGVPEPAANANYSLGGQATAINAGTYKTTATLKSTNNYQWADNTTAAKTLEWKIKPAALASVTAPDQTYNGKAKTPALTVKSKAISNNIVPSSGSSNSAYEVVKWENNTNVGTAKVTVKGKDNFTGTVSGTFKINAKPINATTVSATLSPTSYAYDGKAKIPAVTVKDSETGKTLVKDTDYTVAYKNNTNTGTASATITGKGNYSGTTTKTFNITGGSKTVTVVIKNSGGASQTFSSTGTVSLKLSATDSNGSSIVARVQAKVDEYKKAGYTQIDWGGWDKAKDGTFYAAKANYTVTMTKPAAKPSTKSIGTDNKSISAANPAAKTENGKKQAPSITVKDGNTTLKEGTDYTISWKPNADFTKAGTYTGTITGKGAYTGSRTVTYTINPKANTASGTTKPVTTKASHTVTVNFVDASGNKIAGRNGLEFKSSEGSALSADFVKKVNDRLAELKKSGWSEVSNPFKGAAEKVGTADRTITIKLKSSTTTVTPATYKSLYKPGTKLNTAGTQKVPNNLALTKDVTRTITYKMPDATKAPAKTVQKVTFTRNAVIDNATGKVTYTAWTPASGTWPAVTPPTVSGYAADGVAKVTVKPDTRDMDTTVNYIKTKVDISKPASKIDVSSLANQTFDGTAKTPKPVVKANGKTLKEGTDYTLTYKENIQTGKATVVVSGKGDYTGSVTRTFQITKPSKIWHRLWGQTYYDTMQAIAQDSYGWARNSGGTVIVATSYGYWDALSAAGVAGLYNAPILITAYNSLSPQTKAELKRINPDQVIIAGGPNVVQAGVERSIRSALPKAKVNRTYGQSATDTAAELAKKYFPKGKAADNTAILATSKGYWDALSASPISYAKHYPIFLVEDKNTISNKTLSAMKACGITKVIIAGGTSVVNTPVVTTLKSNGISVADRLWGQTLYDTSREVAKWGLSHGMSANKMGVATSYGYYDALCGAALCGKNNAVLVLADGKNFKNTSVPASNKSRIARAYVFGGYRVVENPVFDAFEATTK